MSPNPSQTVTRDHPEKPARRGWRVLSERTSVRRDKLRAGLTEPSVVAEDIDLVNNQVRDLYFAFKPRNGWQDWLTGAIATLLVRIDRCERIERKLRDYASYRAIDFWEDDQTLEVETLASKIDRDPGRVVAKLRQTPAGLDWLLKRWRPLATVGPRDWTDEQRALAGRLTGGDSELDPTRPGFAAEQVAELEARRTRVEEADAILRGLVEADLSDDAVPGLAKLRRYARSLHRQLKWYVDQFQVKYPDKVRDDPHSKPVFFGMSMDPFTIQPSTSIYAKSRTADDEAKPLPPIVTESRNDETKPTPIVEAELPIEPEQEIDETKPTGRPDSAGTLAAKTEAEVVNHREVSVSHDDSDEEFAVVERSKRGDPVRDANRRQKIARRCAAPASLSGV